METFDIRLSLSITDAVTVLPLCMRCTLMAGSQGKIRCLFLLTSNKAFLLVQALEVSLGGPKLPCIYLDAARCLVSLLIRLQAGI